MIAIDKMIEAARRIIESVSENYRKSLLNDLDNATFEAMNQNGSIFEAVYVDYKRSDQAENQVGPLGTMLDLDGSAIDMIVYWDRNRRISEIEFMKKSDDDDVHPDWATLKIQAA